MKPLEILTSNFDKPTSPSGRNTDLHHEEQRQRSQFSVLNGQKRSQNFVQERNLQNQIHQLKQAKRALVNKNKFPAYGAQNPGRRSQTPSANSGILSPQNNSNASKPSLFSPKNAVSRRQNSTALTNQEAPKVQQTSQVNIQQPSSTNLNETYQQHLNIDILKNVNPSGTSFDNLVSLNILDQNTKEMKQRSRRIDKLNKIQQKSSNIVAELKAKFLSGDKLSKQAQEEVVLLQVTKSDPDGQEQTVAHMTSASSTNLHNSNQGAAAVLSPINRSISSSRVHSEAAVANYQFQNQQKLLRQQAKMQDHHSRQTPIDIVTEGMDQLFTGTTDHDAVLALSTPGQSQPQSRPQSRNMQRSMEIIRNNNNRQINCITPQAKRFVSQKKKKNSGNLQDQLSPGEEIALNKTKPEQQSLNLAMSAFDANSKQVTNDYRRAQSAIQRTQKSQTLAMYGSNQVNQMTNQKQSFLPAIEKKGSIAAYSHVRSSHPDLARQKFEPVDSEQMMAQQAQIVQQNQLNVMLQKYFTEQLGSSALNQSERDRISAICAAKEGTEMTDILDQVVKQYMKQDKRLELTPQKNGSNKTVEVEISLTPKQKLLKSKQMQQSPIKDNQSYSQTEITRSAALPQNVHEGTSQNTRAMQITSNDDSIHSRQDSNKRESSKQMSIGASGSTMRNIQQPAYEIKLRKQNTQNEAPETPKIIDGKRQQRVQFQSPEQQFIKEDFLPFQKVEAVKEEDVSTSQIMNKDLTRQFKVNMAPKNVWLDQQSRYAEKKKFFEDLKPVRQTPPPFPRCLSNQPRQIKYSSKQGNAVFVSLFQKDEEGLLKKLEHMKLTKQKTREDNFQKFSDDQAKITREKKEKERKERIAREKEERSARTKNKVSRRKDLPSSGSKGRSAEREKDKVEKPEQKTPSPITHSKTSSPMRSKSFLITPNNANQINIQINKEKMTRKLSDVNEPKSALTSSPKPGRLRRQSSSMQGGKWISKMHAMRQKALQPQKSSIIDLQPNDLMEDANSQAETEPIQSIFIQMVEDICPIQYNSYFTAQAPQMEQENDDLNPTDQQSKSHKKSSYFDNDTTSGKEEEPPEQINIAIEKENKKKDGKARPTSANPKGSYQDAVKKKNKKKKKREVLSSDNSDRTPFINQFIADQLDDDLLENQKDYCENQQNVKWSTTAYVTRTFPIKKTSKFQYPLVSSLMARDVRILQVSSKNFLLENEHKNILKLTRQLKFQAFEQFFYACGVKHNSFYFGGEGLMGDPQIYFESNYKKALPNSLSQKSGVVKKNTSFHSEQQETQQVLKTLNADYLKSEVFFDSLENEPEPWESDFDGPTNCVLGCINWDNIVFEEHDEPVEEEDDPAKINIWQRILQTQEHEKKPKKLKKEKKVLSKKETYQSQNGFQWKGVFWPGRQFILHQTNQRDEIPFHKETDPRMTQSISYDWDRPNLDAIEMARRDQIKSQKGDIKIEYRFPAPLKHSYDDHDRMDWYNVHLDYKKGSNCNIIREIIRKTMPDCTDHTQQKEIRNRGYGIFNNLYSEELKMKQREKVKLQDKERAFEEGEITQQILQGDRHYYDTTEIVQQIEQEFERYDQINTDKKQQEEEKCFLKFADLLVKEHPDYGYLVQLDLFLKKMDLNSEKYSNTFLKKILPANEEEIAERQIEPTVKLVWMLQMDQRLLDAIQNPFYSPFQPPKLLQDLAMELNVFHMKHLSDYYKEMIYPEVGLNQDINNKAAFPLRRSIIRQCLDHFNMDIVIGEEQQHRSARLFTRKLASSIHRHLQNKTKVNIACSKQLYQREPQNNEDFRELKRHWSLPDDVDEQRDLAMRPFVVNDYTNVRNRLLKPEFKQYYDQQKLFGLVKLLGTKDNGELHTIAVRSQSDRTEGLNIQPENFREFPPVKIHLNPDEFAATNVAANFVKRNEGTLLNSKTAANKKSQDIINAFDQYQRKWHVSANFIHMCGFYFDGGPEDARLLEQTQGQRTWNENFAFYDIFVPVFEPAPEYMVPKEKSLQIPMIEEAPKFSLDDLNRVSSDAEVDSFMRGQTISLSRDKMPISGHNQNSKVMSLSSKTQKDSLSNKSAFKSQNSQGAPTNTPTVKMVKISSHIVDQPITGNQIAKRRSSVGLAKMHSREQINISPISHQKSLKAGKEQNTVSNVSYAVGSSSGMSKSNKMQMNRIKSAKQPKSKEIPRQISITIASPSSNQLSRPSLSNAPDVVSILKNVHKMDSTPSNLDPQFNMFSATDSSQKHELQNPLTINTLGLKNLQPPQPIKTSAKTSGKKSKSKKATPNEKKNSQEIDQKPQNTFQLVTGDQLLAKHAQQKTDKTQNFEVAAPNMTEESSKKKKSSATPQRKTPTPTRKKAKNN